MIPGQLGDFYQLFPVEVHSAKDMFSSIGETQKWYLENKVIAACLVHHLLCQGYGFPFAFHDDEGFHIVVVDDDVAPAAHAVERDGPLHLHQFQGIEEFCVQIVDEVLPDPFFGSQCNIAVTDYVKDLSVPGSFA